MTHYSADPWADQSPSLAAKLAQFFRRHPNQWIDGKTLSTIAGYAAWRTRCSDLRRPPFNMHVIDRQRRIAVNGKPITVTEYKFVVQDVKAEEGAAVDAEDAGCSV